MPPALQRHLQPDQAAQSPSSLTWSVSRDQASTTSLGNVFHHCHHKEGVFLISSLTLPLLALPSFVVMTVEGKKLLFEALFLGFGFGKELPAPSLSFA